MSDERLIREAQSGDAEALEELCRREWRPIYALLYATLQNRSETEDVTQEVFLRALRVGPVPCPEHDQSLLHAMLSSLPHWFCHFDRSDEAKAEERRGEISSLTSTTTQIPPLRAPDGALRSG